MKVSTYFALMAEFGTGQPRLEDVCEKYFDLSPSEAKRRAVRHKLPVPAFRAGSNKSGWLISIADLAEHVDRRLTEAREDWLKSRSAGKALPAPSNASRDGYSA